MRYGPSQSDDCKIFKLTISLERNDEIVCVLLQSHENLVDLQIMGWISKMKMATQITETYN